jgi:hypothetical protein
MQGRVHKWRAFAGCFSTGNVMVIIARENVLKTSLKAYIDHKTYRNACLSYFYEGHWVYKKMALYEKTVFSVFTTSLAFKGQGRWFEQQNLFRTHDVRTAFLCIFHARVHELTSLQVARECTMAISRKYNIYICTQFSDQLAWKAFPLDCAIWQNFSLVQKLKFVVLGCSMPLEFKGGTLHCHQYMTINGRPESKIPSCIYLYLHAFGLKIRSFHSMP